MTYGVEALPLLREEVEDCPPTKASLVLIDEFCELNERNYNFVCYVKLYFTTEEIIVARRKIWNGHSPAFTFSRVHRIKDIVFKKEAYLTDIITVVDSSKDQKFYYQIHFAGDLKQWFAQFERYSKWHQNRKESGASAVAADNLSRTKTVNGSRSGRVSSMVLWNRADFQYLDSSARSKSVSSSQDLSSHLVTPIRNSRLFNPVAKLSVQSCDDDVPSSPELQESSGIDLDNMSMHEEGDTSKDEVEKTFSAMEAWTPASDDFVTASSYSSESQMLLDDDKIRTLNTVVCHKGHSRNKSTSLTRGVKIVTRSDSTVSNAVSDPGTDLRTDSNSGLAYTNKPAVLKSISFDYRSRSNSFLASPFRHTQIRGKKVKFSPRQKMFSTLPVDDDSEQCLIYENDTQDDSYCSITPENSTPSDNNEDTTPILLTPTTPAAATKHDRRESSIHHATTFTPPKRKLVARLFRRRTTSSISDIDDGSHLETDLPETFRPLKKKLYQLDPKLVAAQLVLLDAEMLRRIKPDELKGGAWVGKNKETRAPNVMKMVKEFNRLALLVPTEILEEKSASARAKVIACYIQIADKCRNYGNYNSLKAILAGLQCTPIYRLKKTWKEVSGRRKKKFEDLSRLMSEEDNWRVYKTELYDVMSKGTCVPFLGQFLTQIMQQETAKEVKSYRKKSQGRRPQSGDMSSDQHETVSAPTSPVNSDNDDELNATSKATENSEPRHEEIQEQEVVKKPRVVQRNDTLSPLPTGKFKKNNLFPNNSYKENSSQSSLTPAMKLSHASSTRQESDQADLTDSEFKSVIENSNNVIHKSKGAEYGISKEMKALSLESLDSYDGASSCYSRGSTPLRDISLAVPLDSEAEEDSYDNAVLDVSQVELNIEHSMDTPTCECNADNSPVATSSTPIENVSNEGSPNIDSVTTSSHNPTQTSDTSYEDVEESVESKTFPARGEGKKRRWSSLRRSASPPPADSNSSVVSCHDNTPHKKESKSLRRKLSSPAIHSSSPSCGDNTPQQIEKDTLRREISSPTRSSTPVCNDEMSTPQRNKRGLRRKLSSPLRGQSDPNHNDCPPARREKFRVQNQSDTGCFDVHSMMQQMQLSSMRYMKSLCVRLDVQSFIKGLHYNTEERNYHISTQTEPIDHNRQPTY